MPNTRERLLEAALELFAKQGFHETSLRQIGAEVGVRNSAIYAHFASKQEVFDTLLDSVGLLDLQLLGCAPETLADRHPARALPELVERIMAAFNEERARRFASVLMREGLVGEATGGRSMAESIATVQAQLHAPFRAWAAAGLLRGDIDPDHLVWELLAPLANARFIYLHATSSPTDRARGLDLARKHAEFFVTCCVTSTDAGPATSDRSGE